MRQRHSLLPRQPVVAALAVALVVATSPTDAQVRIVEEMSACGPLSNAYGPYDYRRDKGKLEIVEGHHFTPQVELLIRGISGPIGGELDYVLRASPNHHRALMALIRYGERLKTDQPQGARYTIECFLERAVRFAKDDPIPRMLYARYLHAQSRTAEGLVQLDAAVALAGENALTHYNAGLVFFEIGQFDRALAQAHKAAALGYPREDLKQMLEKAGKWREPGS